MTFLINNNPSQGLLPRARGGAQTQNPGGILGELMVSEAMAQYYAMVKSGMVFSVSASAVNPAAFTGGAAGTPMIGLYNPASSGVDLVILQAVLGVRTTGTAAVATDFNFWTVNQGGVAVTGTQTAATSLYSQAATGAQGYAMVNVANTAALATTLRRPSVSVGLTAATAVTDVGVFVDDIKGLIVLPPGGYLAWGIAAALTAGSFDASLLWAETPL